MEFGKWLEQVRLERKMDLRALAEQVGVDISTISRIENMKTQATLATAIHICEGLGVTLPMLLGTLLGISSADMESLPPSGENVNLTLDDIQAFLTYMNRDRHKGSLFLAEMMNTIASLQLGGSKQTWANGARLFSSEVVDQLSLDLPLYHFELHYPPEIETDDIWDMYRHASWLGSIDVGIYIQKARREKRRPFVRFQRTAKVSDTVLARLEEGALERVKLNDVIMLDEQLGQAGKILAMYWRVYQLNEKLMNFLSHSDLPQNGMPFSAWVAQQMRLVLIFTILCRWFQQEYRKEHSWMSKLRRQFAQSTPTSDRFL